MMAKNRIPGRKQRLLLTITCLLVASGIGLAGCGAERSAKDYYQSGMKCLDGGSYEEAEKYFAMALDKKNDKAEYYIADGLAYVKLGEYEKAREQFDHAIIDKANQIVRENNKMAYRGKALSYYEENDYENALVCLDKALEISVKAGLDADLLSYKGDVLYRLGNYGESAKAFTTILESDKKNAFIYQKRALAYEKGGKTDEAAADFDMALKYDKKNREIYLQKYLLCVRCGKEEEAKKTLDASLALKVRTASDACYHGRFLYYQGKHGEAVEELEKAWEKEAFAAYYFLGGIMEEQGDNDKAQLYYEKYVEKDKSHQYAAAAYNRLGLLRANKEDYSQALSCFQKGLEWKDANEERNLQYNMVIALERMGDYERAQIAADKYVSVYGGSDGMGKELDFIESRLEEGKQPKKSKASKK